MNYNNSKFYNLQAPFLLLVLVFVIGLLGILGIPNVFAQGSNSATTSENVNFATSTDLATSTEFKNNDSQNFNIPKQKIVDSDEKSRSEEFEFEQISDKKAFSIADNPEMEFSFKKKENFAKSLWSSLKGIFVDEYKNIKVDSIVLNKKGEQEELDVKIEYLKHGKFKINLNPENREMKIGKYQLNILIQDQEITDGEIIEFNQDFTWGVLAFNTNKATFRPNELAYLQMAVLDDFGDTICDADINLTIIDPKGDEIVYSTEAEDVLKRIIRNPECNGNNVMYSPDYYAYFNVSEIGEYQVVMLATTENGERELADKFYVAENKEFEIERTGPTRIYPYTNYNMSFEVLVNEDFTGRFVEQVPKSFNIENVEIRDLRTDNRELIASTTVIEKENEREIVWENLDLHMGDRLEFSYMFDPPNISPEFYLVGPAEFESENSTYREARAWQIASDAVGLGLAKFMATSTTYSIDLNQTTAYGLVWGAQDMDIGTYSYSSSNSSRINILEDGDYFLALNLPLYRSDANNNRTRIVSEVRVNGLKYPVGVGKSSYIRNTSDHSESSDHLNVLLNDLNENDYVEVFVYGSTSNRSSVYITDHASVFLEKIDNTRVVFNATSTETTNSTNLNDPTAYPLLWNETRKSSGFTHSAASQSITLDEIGNYVVYINVPLYGAVARGNVRGQVLLDGTPVSGGLFKQGYIRTTDADNESSIHWSGVVQTTAINQVLTITTQEDNTSGTITTGSDANDVATIFIERLESTDNIYYGRANQLSSGTDWNPATAGEILWETDDIIDTNTYTHTPGTAAVADEITVGKAGDYFVAYNDNMDSSGGRPNPLIQITVNGTEVPGAQTKSHYIRLSGQESSAQMSYLLEDLAVNDVIRLTSVREADTDIVDDDDDAVLFIKYLDERIPPTGTFNSVVQKTDGSGAIDISIDALDANHDDVRAKIEFATGTDCLFTISGDPTIDTTDSNVTASYGDPDIDNDFEYQVGTTSAMIQTYNGVNTVQFDWLSKQDTTNASTTYCLRLTVNDTQIDQTTSATTTITIDNYSPQITSVEIPTLMYAVNDTLTATITVETDSSVYTIDTGLTTINGASTTNLVKISDTIYTLDYVVQEGDTDRASGTIPVSIVLVDSFGNQSVVYTSVTVNQAAIDANSPDILSVATENIYYGIGDTLTATITVAYDEDTYSLGNSSINGSGLSNFREVVVDWSFPAWDYRKKITINSSQITSDETNFIILATTTDADLAFTEHGGKVGMSDGSDIFVTDSSDNLLDFERVYYSSSTGEIVFWIKTDISASVDTEIYFYYGNDGSPTDLSNPSAVWDGDFQGVYHLDGDLDDSSQNVNDGTNQGSIDTSGVILNGRSFAAASSQYFTVTSDLSQWLGNSNSSLSFWMKTTQTGSDTNWQAPGITGTEESGGANDIFWGWLDASGQLRLDAGNTAGPYTSTDINDDVWRYYTLTYNSTTGAAEIYVNGVLDGSGTTEIPTSISFYSFGRIEDSGGTPVYFDGELDEITFTDTILTDHWIESTYINQKDVSAFLSFEEEEYGNVKKYAVDYLVSEGDSDRSFGTIPYSIILLDEAGNANLAEIGALAEGAIDANSPIIQNIFIQNGIYGIGDSILIQIDADQTGYSLVSGSTVNGKTLTGFYDNGDTTYDVYYTVSEGDTDRSAGTIPIEIALSDLAGNESASSTTPVGNSASVDANKPVITAISIPDALYSIDDTITVTVTVEGDDDVYTLGTTTVNNVDAENLVRVSSTIYTFDYTVAEGDTDRASGTIPVSVMLTDPVGHYNDVAFTTVDANDARIDANPPQIISIAFTPSSGVMAIGSSTTAVITANESDCTASAIYINGVNVTASFSNLGGGDYQVSYTVSRGDTDHPDDDDLPVNVTLIDFAGNVSVNYTAADSANRPGVDANPPEISSVTFEPSSGVLKVGDTATATILSDDIGYTLGSSTINSVDVGATFIDNGDNSYTLSYTVTEGDNDILDSEDLPVEISLFDDVYNESDLFNTSDPDNRPGVDAHTPTISNVTFEPSSGVLKVGDIATATITVSPLETGLVAGTVMTINNVDVSGTFTDIGSGQYTVIYIVTEGDTDISDSSDLPIDITIQDSAGNVSPNYTTADPNNRPGVDGNTPQIMTVVFEPSSGTLIVGDTATATINMTNNETGLLAGTVMTINNVDVSGTFTDIGSGQYTVTYTVSEGDDDIDDTTEALPINLNIQDVYGNISSASTSIGIDSSPGVDAHTPIISNVTFEPTSGILIVGDIATATITVSPVETGLLAGTVMTINNVDVSSTFTDIGSGQYTVTYTVSESNTDISDSNDLPINITIQDFAGNVSPNYTTADPDNRPGVDGNTPVITNVSFNPSSGMLKVGDTATSTITVNNAEIGLLAGTTTTINGVDVSATFNEIGGGQYTLTYTVSEGDTDISDASDLPVDLTVQDNAGNVSPNYTTADSNGRPGVDGNTPSTPGNLSFYHHTNESITITFGSASTDSNFTEYKIFYKEGISGVSENDNEWDQTDDSNLGNISFNSATSTTITGLATGTDYVFNIWVYDIAGNSASALIELQASTNKVALSPEDLIQKENDNVTVVDNGEWAIDQTVLLAASSTDPEGEFIDYYFEVLPVASTSATATSVPIDACHSGDTFNDCTSKVWKYSTGPSWYDTDWLYRKQISIDSDIVVADLQDFPILANAIDEDLKREARSDGYDIMFTSGDGVTPLNFERKLWDSSTGEIIAWIKTDLSASTDNFIYMYYGNSTYSTDNSTTTGVWDTSYLGVWHMDEEPTGSTDDIKDSSGNDNHMTSYNMDSSKRIQTDSGYAYEFDGAGDYLEDADGENYVNGLDEFTVELWLKSDVIGSDRGFIIGEAPAGNDSFFTLRYDAAGANNGGAYTNLVKGAITTDITGEVQYESSQGVQTTDWQHLVFRWQETGEYEVLINGVTDSYTYNDGGATGVTTGADRLRIGQGGKDTTTALGWDGLIDEVRISNVYRSDAWEQTSYNNQSNPASFALFGAQDAVRIFNIPESSTGYKWQVMVCDEHNLCTEWVPYNSTIPNFKVDNTPPTAPGSLVENVANSTSVTFNLGATSTESFFDEYRIYYKIYDGTPVSTEDYLFASSDDANLGNILYNGASTTTVDSLTADTQYEFNIWAFDESGQSASATPITATTNYAANYPSGTFNSAVSRVDGSGVVDLSIEIDDSDNDDTVRARIDYVSGSTCDFSTPLDPTLDESSSNITADNLPIPDIDNTSTYQVGTNTAWILTSPGSNTVTFDWLSEVDLPSADGEYCLRLIANDGTFDQSPVATTTLTLDNVDPTNPGALTVVSRSTYSITIGLNAASTETNFSEYRIFYKEGNSGVTELDTLHSSTTDVNLGYIDYNGANSTIISGLSEGTEYVFNIWAYDEYGNKSSSTVELTTSTNDIPASPVSLFQYQNDEVTEILNEGWTDEDNVKLFADITDGDTSEVLTVYFEAIISGGTYSGATTSACSASADWSSCTSKIWSVTSVLGNYSVTPYTATVNPTNIPDSSTGYKWRVQACDDDNVCSPWILYNASLPNFKIDTTLPTAPGNLSSYSTTGNTATLTLGATTTELNFAEYRLYYKEGSSGVTESDSLHSSTTDLNLADILYNGATSTIITGLNPGTEYVVNIWAYDEAGNKANATEVTFTTNSKPLGVFIDAIQKTDGSGGVDVTIQVDDNENSDLRARVDYVYGTSCDFSTPLDPTLDETDENATSTEGDPKIENDNDYQIGNDSGWIPTTAGVNTIYFDWLSKTDIDNEEGYYCLRLIVNDFIDDQDLYATSSVYIDNVVPSPPGNLSLVDYTGSTMVLAYGATTTESNFLEYKIFYIQGSGVIDEDDPEHDDSNLDYIDYNGATTTTVSGLNTNSQYSFKIYAYDQYGNKSASGQTTYTTNALPSGLFNYATLKTDGTGIADIEIEVYDTNLDECTAKIEYEAGTACTFGGIPARPTLDENQDNIDADYGTPGIENDSEYQIGTSTKIKTASGSNSIAFDWDTRQDIPTASGEYCLRLTVNDGFDDQLLSATTTLIVDNVAPIAPGDLVDDYVTGLTIRLDYGLAGSDDYFKEYKIFYKEGTSGVSQSDTEWNQYNDASLGDENFLGISSTTITGLTQNTDYVFNIWIYDDYGNIASATNEVSTSTKILPTASWREAQDVTDPTVGNYLVREQPVRIRVAIANAGEWDAAEYQYLIEYAELEEDCASVSSWDLVPIDYSGTEDWEMIESSYVSNGQLTTSKLSGDGYTFQSGMIVEDPSNLTSVYTLQGNYYTEMEYVMQATASSTPGQTYCFRLTNDGEELETYDQYPELTIAPAATTTFNQVAQKTDGSHVVDISMEVTDMSGDLNKVKIEYEEGTDCLFTTPLDPTLIELQSTIVADFGTPIISNDSEYQIGTSTGMIITQFGPNTVEFDWSTPNDLIDVDSEYCLRITANDGYDDQFVPATTTVIIDQVPPGTPPDMTLVSKSTNSVTLSLGTTTDTNFSEYRIYYKEGEFGVTQSDILWDSSDDSNLGFEDLNGATTTTITGLTANKVYTFQVWAFDAYGNNAESLNEIVVSLAYKSKSENWQFFHDIQNETPTSTAASENVSPNDITSVSPLKLRLALREVESVTGDNIKMRLQYSTYSDFTADVYFVGEPSSSTVWTYWDGVDENDDPITQTVLTGVTLGATHNETGMGSSTFNHLQNSVVEWEFTIRSNGAPVNNTYYFRAYDTLNDKPVVTNDSYTYPSLITSEGTISFVVSGVGLGAITEGVETDIETTPTSINFGNLSEDNEKIGAQRFTVNTNAGSGYQLFVYQRSNFISNGGHDINPVPNTNESPDFWPISPFQSAFGYHTGDDTLSGMSPARFSSNNTYAQFETNIKEISYSAVPVQNEVIDFVYRVEISNLQEAGDYNTDIVYILVPNFY